MKRILLASVAAAALWSAPSFAADPGVPMEEAPIGFSWTGGYVGVQAGYGWGNSDTNFDQTGFPGWGADVDVDGFLGGVYAGYNYQFGNGLVVGAEADFAFSGIDGSGPILNPAGVAGTDVFPADINWTGAVRARLGYGIDRFLPYVAGGIAFADREIQYNAVGQTNIKLDDTAVGWTIGAGLEYAVNDNLIARAEYRYSDFGTDRAAGGVGDDFDVDLQLHDVRIGIAYKF